MILSGYDFANFDQGAPLDSNNRALDTTCFANGWRCEHRWTAISNMVRCVFLSRTRFFKPDGFPKVPKCPCGNWDHEFGRDDGKQDLFGQRSGWTRCDQLRQL